MKRGFCKGMTILEVSIASLILGIALIGILSVIYQASRFSMLVRNRVKANQIAQARLEEIKNMSYASIQNSTAEEDSLPQGEITVAVTELDEGKVVKVSVDWEKPGNGPPEELVTLIRRP